MTMILSNDANQKLILMEIVLVSCPSRVPNMILKKAGNLAKPNMN